MLEALKTQTEETSDFYDDGFLRVEYESFYATWKGNLIRLSRSDFLIISRLVQKRERFVSSKELWSLVWSDRKKYNDESIRVYMCKVRQHLEPLGMKIENLAGVGYRFVPYNNS